MSASMTLIGMTLSVILAAGIGLWIDKKRRERLQKQQITIDEKIYLGLHTNIGRRKISQFIEDLVRLYTEQSLEDGYKALAMDKDAEQEAMEWSEATIQDIDYEA